MKWKNLFKRKEKNLAETFSHLYYHTDTWQQAETGSGPGSTLENTIRIRQQIPALLKTLDIKTLLDAPCGDFNWMNHMPLNNIQYTGIDVIPALIEDNKKKYPDKNFVVADLTKDPLPGADIVLCRDCFIHLPNHLIKEAIENFRRSGIKYLLTNTYNFIESNKDIKVGDFRMINLRLAPFYFPEPLYNIEEEYTSGFPDKQLAVWRL